MVEDEEAAYSSVDVDEPGSPVTTRGLAHGPAEPGPMVFLTFFLTSGELLANFERPVLGCIDAKFCK